MRNRFDRQLEELNANMIQMGNDISKAIERAIDALQTLDVERQKMAVEADEGTMISKERLRTFVLNSFVPAAGGQRSSSNLGGTEDGNRYGEDR